MDLDKLFNTRAYRYGEELSLLFKAGVVTGMCFGYEYYDLQEKRCGGLVDYCVAVGEGWKYVIAPGSTLDNNRESTGSVPQEVRDLFRHGVSERRILRRAAKFLMDDPGFYSHGDKYNFEMVNVVHFPQCQDRYRALGAVVLPPPTP